MRHFLSVSFVSVLLGTGISCAYAAEPTPQTAAPAVQQPADDSDWSFFHVGDFNNIMPTWMSNPGSIHLFSPSQPEPVSVTNASAPTEPGRPIAPALLPDYVEVGTNYSMVSNSLGNWFGQYVRGEMQTDADNRWNATLAHQQEFHDDAFYGSVGNTHIFNADWYSDVDIGASPEGLVMPQYRADAFINRKFLPDRSLVGTLGVSEYMFRDGHKTSSLFVGSAWYLAPRWVLQDGINFNVSSPGGVFSPYAFVAITEGRNKNYFITARQAFGREAYQVLGGGRSISDFASQDISLTWKQWMLTDWGYDDKWGFIVGGEYYTNPNYHRIGSNIALFREF